MEHKIIGVFKEHFVEVHNSIQHNLQQIGRRWGKGDIVESPSTLDFLLKMGAPLQLFSSKNEENTGEIPNLTILDKFDPEVQSEDVVVKDKKKKNDK